ncbi:unnamed protein product, partial [Protopolystoma xenopodis]
MKSSHFFAFAIFCFHTYKYRRTRGSTPILTENTNEASSVTRTQCRPSPHSGLSALPGVGLSRVRSQQISRMPLTSSVDDRDYRRHHSAGPCDSFSDKEEEGDIEDVCCSGVKRESRRTISERSTRQDDVERGLVEEVEVEPGDERNHSLNDGPLPLEDGFQAARTSDVPSGRRQHFSASCQM